MEVICLKIKTTDIAFGKVLQRVLRSNYKGFLVDLELKEKILKNKDDEEGETSQEDSYLMERQIPYDLCLIDGDIPFEDGDVLLVDNPALENINENLINKKIFKYTSAGELISKILKILSYNRKEEIFFNDGAKGEIITIASSVGGIGSTSMGLAICQELKRYRNKNVFFLSLEQFSSLSSYEREGGGEVKLKEFLYRFSKESNNKVNKNLFDEVVFENSYNVEMFNMGEYENPLFKISSEEIHRLILSLFNYGYYDYIVIDMGNNMGDTSISVLKATDYVFFLMGPQRRDNLFYKHVGNLCKESVMAKFHLIKNKAEVYEDESEDEETASGHELKQIADQFFDERNSPYLEERKPEFLIPLDEEAFTLRTDMLDINLASNYGEAIKILTRSFD